MGDIVYSISSDTFNGEADETQLINEILASGVAIPEAGLLSLVKLDRLGDALTITHTPTLNIVESGSLTLVVAAHSGFPLTDIFTPGPDDELTSHSGDPTAHHVRYEDAEAIAASSGALDHHSRYTDAEVSDVIATGVILETLGNIGVDLLANLSTSVTAPTYATLLTLPPFTTVTPTGYLMIRASVCLMHLGGFAGNVAPAIRIRLNGVLQAGGGTVNTVENRIMPIIINIRRVVTAGPQTVVLEWTKFGDGTNTLVCQVASLPDLMHAHLDVQEQRS